MLLSQECLVNVLITILILTFVQQYFYRAFVLLYHSQMEWCPLLIITAIWIGSCLEIQTTHCQLIASMSYAYNYLSLTVYPQAG